MAIIKKTITGLKPGTNYLFSLKPKNTEISAVDPIPDTIRVQTPGVASTPSSITGVVLAANYKSAMLRFNHTSMVDLDYYEYKIYLANDLTETALKARPSTVDAYSVSGITKSNLVVISDLDNTNLIDNVTTTISYKAKVRAINTGGKAGAWSSASNSSDTELIESQFILDLTAAKITAGTIGAQEIILTNSEAPSSYTPPAGMAVLRSSDYVSGPSGQGWLIRGDGYAEFDATNIRGSLTANSISLDTYNYWKPEVSPGTGYQFEAGNGSDKVLKWSTTTGILTIKGTMSGGSVGGATVNSDKIFLGTGTYANSNTPFFVGMDSGVNKFSLGDKFTWNGSTLSINGGGTFTGALVGGTIQIGSGDSVFKADTNGIYLGNDIFANAEFRVTPEGGLTATNAAISGTVSGSTITGSTFASTNSLFRVDGSGNAFANNIYATGGTNETGLQVRADGGVDGFTGTAGSLWLLSSVGTRTTDSSQYGIRLGSSSAYLSITYPRNPNTTGGREHVNIETNSGKYLRLSTPTGQIGLLGNTQTQRTQNAVTVAGDIVLENYGPDADENDGNAPSGSRTVYSKNIGNSSSATYCRIGLLDGLQFYGDPSSLRELKDNIEDITGEESINLIKKLRPRKYTWKPEENDSELQKALKNLDIHYGFVAEEVQEADRALATYKMTPEFQQQWPNVTEEMFNDFPLIFYKEGAMPSITISAVKNLIERVEYLESQLAAQ